MKKILIKTFLVVSLILATTSCTTIKGDTNMATIITIDNGDSGAVVRGAINDNFTDVNAELEADTTAIGTLASLNTTEKSNLVGAVNEVIADKVESIYGEMWSAEPSVGVLNLSSNSAYSSFSANLELKYGNGITYESSALKIGTSGRYLITFTCVLKTDTNTTSVDFQILKNGGAVANGKIREDFPTSQQTKTVSSCFIEELTANDLIKIGFRRSVSTTFNVIVANYYLTITKV
jgi:hypothetical protein